VRKNPLAQRVMAFGLALAAIRLSKWVKIIHLDLLPP
jgi:hypothetical protein